MSVEHAGLTTPPISLALSPGVAGASGASSGQVPGIEAALDDHDDLMLRVRVE